MTARLKISYRWLFTVIAIWAALAFSGMDASAQSDTYSELAKVPAKAAARRNPFQGDADAIPGGAKLFNLHCAECHGDTAEGGKGKKKGPSLRVPEVQQAAPGALFWLLTNGVVRRGMPVWSKLPEPQRWQLVSYIKSLGPGAPPAPEDKPSQPPSSH
jgi:mono/diheme cytochrome c family protein